MDQKFKAEQWKRAEAATMNAISDAEGSARVVTEMLRIWENGSAHEHANTCPPTGVGAPNTF